MFLLSEYPECLTQKRRSTEAGRKVSHVDKALDQWDPSSKFYRVSPKHRNTNSSEVLKVEHWGHSRRDDHHWLSSSRGPRSSESTGVPCLGLGASLFKTLKELRRWHIFLPSFQANTDVMNRMDWFYTCLFWTNFWFNETVTLSLSLSPSCSHTNDFHSHQILSRLRQ